MNFIKTNRHQCYYCGNKEWCTKDHFYPKSKGGTIIVYACSICQFSKKNIDPLVWLSYMESHVALTKEAKKNIKSSVLNLYNFTKTSSINFGNTDIRI